MRGRPALTDKPVEWKVNIPSSVVAEVTLFLVDPLTGKTTYGARSTLMTQLLREWVSTQKQSRKSSPPSLHINTGE